MPAVYLNHFYITIDSATYLDIEQNVFMRTEFAPNELRTTVRKDTSYTGLYFYGTDTYFEFFNASNPLGRDRFTGDGIALGVDESGALQMIEKNLAPDIILEKESVTRQYSNYQIPWFYSAKWEGVSSGSKLALWFMEYHPQFLRKWNAQPKDNNPGVSRRQILQRYTSVLKEVPLRPYFKNVTTLKIAVNEATRKKLIRLAMLLGFRVVTSRGTTNIIGTDIEFHLTPPTGDKEGIQEIVMCTEGKPNTQSEFRFGERSILRFQGDKIATWYFG